MSPDDIDEVVLKVYDFLIEALGCNLNEDGDYDDLRDYIHDLLEPYVTRDRNYN